MVEEVGRPTRQLDAAGSDLARVQPVHPVEPQMDRRLRDRDLDQAHQVPAGLGDVPVVAHGEDETAPEAVSDPFRRLRLPGQRGRRQ